MVVHRAGKSREEWVKKIFGVVKVYCTATGDKPQQDPLKVTPNPTHLPAQPRGSSLLTLGLLRRSTGRRRIASI